MDERRELIADARMKGLMAEKAEKAGNKELSDAFLTQAADCYREAGLTGQEAWCRSFIGR